MNNCPPTIVPPCRWSHVNVNIILLPEAPSVVLSHTYKPLYPQSVVCIACFPASSSSLSHYSILSPNAGTANHSVSDGIVSEPYFPSFEGNFPCLEGPCQTSNTGVNWDACQPPVSPRSLLWCSVSDQLSMLRPSIGNHTAIWHTHLILFTKSTECKY